MRDPYENILIGNFLYALGFRVGAKTAGKVNPLVVNLTQQTPLDPLLADVHLAYPGAVRLIEFKRKSNRDSKENVRLEHLRKALKVAPKLEPVSRAVHWYIESEEACPEWTTDVRPYLEMDRPSNFKMSLLDFVEQTVNVAFREDGQEFGDDVINLYLHAVALGAEKKAATESGMLFIISNSGALQYVALESIFDLRLELSKVRERMREWSMEIQRARELGREGREFDIADRKMRLNRGFSYER